MNNTHIKQRVMRRVHLIYFMRKVFGPLAMKGAAFFALAGFVVFLVSLENVYANMPRFTNVGAVSQFYVNAFLHTEFVVQAVLIGVIMLLYLLMKDIKLSLQRRRSLAFGK